MKMWMCCQAVPGNWRKASRNSAPSYPTVDVMGDVEFVFGICVKFSRCVNLRNIKDHVEVPSIPLKPAQFPEPGLSVMVERPFITGLHATPE